MPILSIKVDADGPLKACRDLRENQIPWTIARSLTMVAQAGQDAARKLAGQVFRLRNDWTTRNIKIEAATKQNLTAKVFTDTSNRTTGAGDYLPLQQDGGIKVSHRSGVRVAVPSDYLRSATGNGPIPVQLRPQVMLQFLDSAAELTTKQVRRRRQALVNGWYFWLHPNKANPKAIMGRQVNETQVHIFYFLVPDAGVPARFPMENTVRDVVDRQYVEIFRRAATETISNDLLRGSGVSVKL